MGINIKGQCMNGSTFWTIKYINWSVFSKARYMNGVSFEMLARTPVPHLPPSYHPHPREILYVLRDELNKQNAFVQNPNEYCVYA